MARRAKSISLLRVGTLNTGNPALSRKYTEQKGVQQNEEEKPPHKLDPEKPVRTKVTDRNRTKVQENCQNRED